MGFSLSFMFLLFTTNNFVSAHNPGQDRRIQARHAGHVHTTSAPPTTTEDDHEHPEDESCNVNPCLPQCETCKRDGVCEPSCKHEGGYKCVSPSGSLGKNTSFTPPAISCELNEINVAIVDDFFNQPDFGYKYFYISRRLDSSKCTLIRDNDDVQYSSILWADVSGNGYDMPIPIIQFRCDYTTDYYVGTPVKPIVAEVATIVEDGVQLNLDIELCKQSTCLGYCPEELRVGREAIYTIGQRIYVGIKSLGHENSVVSGHTMSLQNVYLSCFGNEDSMAGVVPVFHNGCLGDNIAQLYARPGSLQVHRACFSFVLARLINCKSQFFIHAHVSVCRNANRDCRDGTHTCPNTRSRRSVPGEEKEETLRIGPIMIAEAEVVGTGSHSPVTPGDDLAAKVDFVKQKSVRLVKSADVNIEEPEQLSTEQGISLDLVLIVGISLLLFSVLLFSFLFFQFHSRFIGSIQMGDLKK